MNRIICCVMALIFLSSAARVAWPAEPVAGLPWALPTTSPAPNIPSAGAATEPAKDAKPLEYFTIKDWLVAGPFAVDDPLKDIDKDFRGGEDKVQPGKVFKELGRNVLENIHLSSAGGNPCQQESFYTSPCFEGHFMYLRGEEYLYCIGSN